jgi:hypothetical protein
VAGSAFASLAQINQRRHETNMSLPALSRNGQGRMAPLRRQGVNGLSLARPNLRR